MAITSFRWQVPPGIWLQRSACTSLTTCECLYHLEVILVLKTQNVVLIINTFLAHFYSSADVYSFSMLLWEILTLQKPLLDFTYTRLKNEIFIEGDRPPIRKVFNKKMRDLIASGWSQNPTNRPSMDRVYDELKSEYSKLAPGTVTEAQISHNRRRSTFVAQRISTMSVRHLMRLNSVESGAN